MEMGDQYGLQDLRQLMARRTHFPAIPQATATATEPLFSVHRNLTPPQHYETIMMGRHTGEVILPRGLVDNINNTTATATTSAGHVVCGLEMEGCGITGGEGGNSRWPRQETLTLLEIRSCLDSKFKEANQKGPLWDEVSRIMAEEHGYQRSGKKCREKFENLYKYYKKTKEGKAGRQDGKHYRFFRQLEALYGDTSTNNINAAASASLSETNFVGINTTSTTTLPYQEALQDQNKLCCESLSFTNYSSEFEASSSENNDNNHDQDLSAIAFMMNHSTEMGKNMNETHGFKRARKSWKAKIKDFIDSHMRKLMETQEAWMDKMLKTIEHKEQERLSREEEWRKQEAARFDREYKFWANERALVEARDVALLEALKKLAGKELKVSSLQELIMDKTIHHQDHNIKNMEDEDSNRWHEPEISSLIELRNSMEPRFQESGCLKEGLWDEIAVKMACLGYDRSAISCKENWENAVIYFNKASMDCNKKRKENLRSSNTYFQQPEYSYDHHDQDNIGGRGLKTVGFIQPMINDDLSSSNSNVGTAMHESCFRILGDEGENLGWENYGVKLSKGRN